MNMSLNTGDNMHLTYKTDINDLIEPYSNYKQRCIWSCGDMGYEKYHDEEWGVPLHEDDKLFECLILEIMQAGIAWHIVLNKRESLREAYDGFNAKIIASYSEEKIEELMQNKGIIRYRRKIEATIANAKSFLQIQQEYGSFDNYIWKYVKYKTIQNKSKKKWKVPSKTKLSEKIAKDMMNRGFKFIGATTIYSFMQAVGMVNDHERSCFRYEECT